MIAFLYIISITSLLFIPFHYSFRDNDLNYFIYGSKWKCTIYWYSHTLRYRIAYGWYDTSFDTSLNFPSLFYILSEPFYGTDVPTTIVGQMFIPHPIIWSQIALKLNILASVLIIYYFLMKKGHRGWNYFRKKKKKRVLYYSILILYLMKMKV